MEKNSGNAVIKGCGTHHIAIQTRDWEASLKLYRDVLGMNPVAEFGSPEQKIMLLDTGDGSCIELFEPKPDTPAVDAPVANDPVIHFALTTDNARASLEHVRRAGYEVTVEPMEFTADTLELIIAFFKGPSGEEIEFFQLR